MRQFVAEYRPMWAVEWVAVIVDQPQSKRSEAGFWGTESEADVRVTGETARHLALGRAPSVRLHWR